MCSDCKQQTHRAEVFLYLCPLNFTTLAVFSRGQIATPRFVLSLSLGFNTPLTSNPIGRLMKTHLCTGSRHVPCHHQSPVTHFQTEVGQAVNAQASITTQVRCPYQMCGVQQRLAQLNPYMRDVTVEGTAAATCNFCIQRSGRECNII